MPHSERINFKIVGGPGARGAQCRPGNVFRAALCRFTTYRHRFARAALAPRAKRNESKNRGRASPVKAALDGRCASRISSKCVSIERAGQFVRRAHPPTILNRGDSLRIRFECRGSGNVRQGPVGYQPTRAAHNVSLFPILNIF